MVTSRLFDTVFVAVEQQSQTVLLFSRTNSLRLMPDIIKVADLVEVYSDGTKAIDDISFNVKEGRR